MKKVVLLALLFLGLGAFVYFYEIKGGEEREKAKETEESLLRLQEDQITGLIIERPDSEPIHLTRQGGGWWISQPVDSAVDRFVADALARAAADARRLRTFEDAEDLTPYGVEEPRVRLTVESGDRTEIIRIGKDDYTGNQVYAQLEGEQGIYITNRNLLTSADKKLEELRSKSVLDFKQDEVQVAEIERPEGRLRLEKKEGEWFLTQPIEDMADETTVSSLLSGIGYARVDEFVEEDADPDVLEKYGLQEPVFVFRVREAGQEQWKTLQLGQKENDTFYARDFSRRNVFKVKESVADSLEKLVEDFRDKKIVKTRQNEVDQLTLKAGEKTITVRREGDDFVITEPESEKGSKTALYKFWYPITDVKFESLDDETSPRDDPRFADPDVVIEITLKDGTTRVFEFEEHEGAYLARKLEDGRSGAVSLADFSKLRDASAAEWVTE